MLVGVKFCGGCNPRYDRGKALKAITGRMQDEAEFVIAEEGGEYDYLLVIGGCTNCCASYSQYKAGNGVLRIWDESHTEKIIEELKREKNKNEEE